MLYKVTMRTMLLSRSSTTRHLRMAGLGLGAMLLSVSVSAQPILAVDAVVLDQPVNQMVYDSVRAQLILTIPGTDPVNGDRVGLMDPNTATFTELLDLGTGPDPIDLTDNGQFAFIGLDAQGAVKKLDLNSLEVVETIQFGTENPMFPVQMRADKIVCQPGSDSAFAVVRTGYIQRALDFFNGDTLVYGSGWSQILSDAIQFKTGTPDRLIGISPGFGFGYFRTIAVDGTELDELSTLSGLFFGVQDHAELGVAGDLVLTNDGSVIDVSEELPLPVGACSIPSQTVAARRTCFDTHESLICAAFRKGFSTDTVRILRFDLETLVAQDAIDLVVPAAGAQVQQILCWGPGARYVVSLSNGALVIINGEALPTRVDDTDRYAQLPTLFAIGATLRTSTVHPVRFDLYDGQGRFLGQSDLQGTMDISGLPTAAYAVRFRDLSGRYLGARKWVHLP